MMTRPRWSESKYWPVRTPRIVSTSISRPCRPSNKVEVPYPTRKYGRFDQGLHSCAAAIAAFVRLGSGARSVVHSSLRNRANDSLGAISSDRNPPNHRVDNGSGVSTNATKHVLAYGIDYIADRFG